MHGREVEEKAGMRLHPLLDFLAMMGRDLVTDEVDPRDSGWNFPVQMLQEGNKLALPLARVTLTVDMAGPCIEGSKQIPRAVAPILMLDAVRGTGLARFGGVQAWSGLQRSLFINTQDDLVGAERASVESDEGLHTFVKSSVAGMFGRQPQVMAPGFEFVMVQDPAYGGRRDLLDDPRADQFRGQFGAIPLREAPAGGVGALAGQFDHMERHTGGKRPGGVPVCACLPGRANRAGGSG